MSLRPSPWARNSPWYQKVVVAAQRLLYNAGITDRIG